MAYYKFGPDSVGRIVELSAVDGNLVRMPRRAENANNKRRKHGAKALEFARQIPGASKRTRKPRSLSVKEFHKLLEHMDDPFRTMALTCVCFGLRISEALGLKWSDIDWLNGALRIQRGIVRQRVDETKTHYSERALPIDAEMLEALKRWRQSAQFRAGDDWVFASPVQIGRLPYSADALNDAYEKAGKTSGVGHVSTHTMRHTYRSWLDAVGTSIAVQQKTMRHADIRTTMNVYGDIVTDEMSTALAK